MTGVDNFRTEGHQGEFRQLEALLPKGNADNGDAENQSDDCGFDCHRDAGDQDPDNVQEQ